jgi:hypothetical protein
MKKRSFTLKDFQNILLLVVPVVVMLGGVLVFNWWIAGQFGVGEDVLPAWNGARAFIFEQTDPYSQTVAEKTQREVYGRAAQEGEYPYMLDIPFPLLLPLLLPLIVIRFLSQYLPFIGLPDATWVRAVWMLFSEIGLLSLVALAFRLTDWQPKRWFMLLVLAFSLLWYYPVVALLSGSLSIFLILTLVGALISLQSFNDEAAGILLALASIHWQVTLVLWLFIFLGVFLARRWRVLFGYAITWIVLGGVSFLIYPGWVWPYLRAVVENIRAGELLTPVRFLVVWLPVYGVRLAQGLTVLLALALVLEWLGALRSDNFRRVAWAAALSLAVTPLLGISTSFTDFAPLVFSFAVILPFAWERWEKRPYLVLTIFCLIFFAFPLAIRYQLSAQPFLADGLIFMIPSFLIVIGLYWIRWYVVRPPRTWLDGVKRELRK